MHDSSAEPQALFNYANVSARINHRLSEQATALSVSLQRFAATSSEYATGADGRLANELRTYVESISGTDAWVRQVGEEFERADRREIVQ